MASRSTTQAQFTTKSEAAALIGVEEKPVTHIEGQRADGTNVCPKQVPGLYSADAELIRDSGGATAAQAATEKADKKQAKPERARRSSASSPRIRLLRQ